MNISGRFYMVIFLTLFFGISPLAHAHSPCYDTQGRVNGCLSVHEGPPGTIVETRDVSVLRVVFNLWDGRPEGGPDPSIYHPDLPLLSLREFARPQEGTTFVIPDVPPGTYFIAIFDGSERGKHFTGAPFRVLAATDQDEVAVGPVGSDSDNIPVLALVAGVAFTLGLVIGALFAKRALGSGP